MNYITSIKHFYDIETINRRNLSKSILEEFYYENAIDLLIYQEKIFRTMKLGEENYSVIGITMKYKQKKQP